MRCLDLSAKPVDCGLRSKAPPKTLLLVSAALVALTFVAFWPLTGAAYDFITIDDDEYVVENPHVRTGLSPENLRWAWTAFHSNNWHPLTWLSLQADASIYGAWAPGFHRTNLLWHTATAVLLFLSLARMTAAAGMSAAVAALFAVHPLRVESVAWVAERKDVLSGFFWMLTLFAYAWYAEHPSRGRYVGVALAFALGLLAKPMVITLPIVLLLLDYWPLGRFGSRAGSDQLRAPSSSRLFAEKLPLLVLAGICAAITISAQQNVVQTVTAWPLWVRLLNAAQAYVRYPGKLFWPQHLSIFYPHPGAAISVPLSVAATVVVIAITAAAVVQAKRRPFLLVGWLWYAITLIPVIGIVQVGLQSMADRYTYIPSVGILLMVTWGLRSIPAVAGIPEAGWSAVTALAILLCSVLTWNQTEVWRNGVTILRHAERSVRRNPTVEHCLGEALMKAGDPAAAEGHFRAALELDPNDMFAHYDLGQLLGNAGRLEEAAREFQQAIMLRPTSADAHNFLGETLRALGQEHLARAAQLHAAHRPEAAREGQEATRLLEQASMALRQAVRQDSSSPSAWCNLGKALLMRGQIEEAQGCFRRSLQLQPDQPEARMFLRLSVEMQSRGSVPPAAGKPNPSPPGR